jgi:uncharacterized protein YukE
MDLVQLRAAQPERVFRAAEGINRIRDGLKDAAERIQATVRQPLAAGAWSGAASTAALAHFDRVGQEVAGSVETLGQAGKGVMRFADALADAKAMVARADDIAAVARLTVGQDGSITFPTFTTPLSDAEAQSLKAAGEEAHQLLGKALTIAADADAACAGALAAASGASEATGAAMGSILTAAAPSSGGGGDGGFWDDLGHTAGTLFDDPETDFQDETLFGGLFDGDIWRDPTDGDGFHIGDMSAEEQWVVEEALDLPDGATLDDLVGEGVIDRIEDGGWREAPGAWWDSNWEAMGNVPEHLGESWDNFTEDAGDLWDSATGWLH